MLAWSFFFFKQKTPYEMRISAWSSDVCSSDLSITPEAAAWIRADLHQDLTIRQYTGQAFVTGDLFQLPAAPVEIGSASCRERVCQYVYISVVAVSLKTKSHSLQAPMTYIHLTAIPDGRGTLTID